jgi:hypothetical protein
MGTIGTVTRVHATQDGQERLNIRWDDGGVDLALAWLPLPNLHFSRAPKRMARPSEDPTQFFGLRALGAPRKRGHEILFQVGLQNPFSSCPMIRQ